MIAWRMKKYFLVLPLIIALAAGVFLVTTKKAKLASAYACNTTDLSGQFDYNPDIAYFEGEKLDSPLFARNNEVIDVLGVADSPLERWIEVDLSEQKIKAWEGNTIFLESPVSTGLPQTPTPTGEFRIWIKLRYTKMEGGSGRGYYNLPNVPYTMFLESQDVSRTKGYGLHGTYWHNHFGTPRSHGCVNLPTPIAEKIFHFVTTEGTNSLGTKVIIHE